MDKINIIDLQKSYTDRKKRSTVALYKCNLDVRSGEFLVLLGESGSGKSSLIKVLCGIEPYDFGEVLIDGIPSEKLTQMEKNMSYVSQNIVLYPHQTVFENIMQPLEVIKMPKQDRVNRVIELGKMLGISILLTRRPRELSGGQQQKVAIARAIAKEPSVCLFDEPLSALDESYHDEIIETLIDVHKKTKATYIYSTHNQKEAFRLGDRIAIMNNRKIEQIGTPREIAERPSTLFVAQFLKDIFSLIIPLNHEGGEFINEEMRIRETFDFDAESIRKIGSKPLHFAIKTTDITINENGRTYLKIIRQSANTLTISCLGQEFILPNPDMLDFFGAVRVDIDLHHCPIFFEGRNISDENI